VSAFLRAVDQAALHGTEGGFVLALAHGALREPEHDRPVRRR
jgi:hypothetical protein